jgi:hypothetical protein
VPLGRFCKRLGRLTSVCEDPKRNSLTKERRHEEHKNIDMKVEGNILTITVDLTKEFGPSSSGKTIIIASTEGNVSIADREEKIGLNVYRKKP